MVHLMGGSLKTVRNLQVRLVTLVWYPGSGVWLVYRKKKTQALEGQCVKFLGNLFANAVHV